MRLTCVEDDTVPLQSAFRGEHGLSFLIESGSECILFDTGGTPDVLAHNLSVVGIPPESIGAVALSHGHRDHTGGLPALLAQRPGLPVYAHPEIGRERFSQHDGELVSAGLQMPWSELERSAELYLSAEPQRVLPGIWTTGEIAERPAPEGRSPGHLVPEGDGWVPDPYRDDMALILETERGLVLVCGCAHSGLINTIQHVRSVFARDPIAIIGGLHLAAADEAHMQRLIRLLEEVGPPMLYPNHCTGSAAYERLAATFGERVAPCPAGTVLEF